MTIGRAGRLEAHGSRRGVTRSANGGGLRMVHEPMTVAMLKQRLAEDTKIPNVQARCELYVRLFLHANYGDDVWDEAEYAALGCAEFSPWQLNPGF